MTRYDIRGGSKATLTAMFRKFPKGYIGYVEKLPRANNQGKTLEKVVANLAVAVELALNANREMAEEARAGKDLIGEGLRFTGRNCGGLN